MIPSLGILNLYIVWYLFVKRTDIDFVDFQCYYFAAKGDLLWKPKPDFPGWLYPGWMRFLWKPFTLFELPVATMLWFFCLLVAYNFLMVKLWEIPYGWVLCFASVKYFAVVIGTGNVSVILCALCFHPLGSAVAGICKPYLLGITAIWLAWPWIQTFSAAHSFGRSDDLLSAAFVVMLAVILVRHSWGGR